MSAVVLTVLTLLSHAWCGLSLTNLLLSCCHQALPVYLVLPRAAAAAPCDLGQQQCCPAGGCEGLYQASYAPGILLDCARTVVMNEPQSRLTCSWDTPSALVRHCMVPDARPGFKDWSRLESDPSRMNCSYPSNSPLSLPGAAASMVPATMSAAYAAAAACRRRC
jgi:hypothetical protein